MISSGIGTPKDLYVSIREFHHQKHESEKLFRLQKELIDVHLKTFFASLESDVEEVYKPAIAKITIKLLHEKRFHEISQYLGQIESHGFKQAMAAYHNTFAGGKVGHVWIGITSLMEVAILLFALAYCHNGYERLLISCLSFTYTTIMASIITSNIGISTQVAEITKALQTVRVSLSERIFQWEEHNKEVDQQARIKHKDGIRTLTTLIKLSVMQVIAIVEVLRILL